MPLIIGYNISPLFDNDPHGTTGHHYWRDDLAKVVKNVTRDFWQLGDGEVTCFFPHDPTVPTDHYPVATIVVDLLFDKPDRTPERRKEFAKLLAEAVRDRLNKQRGTTDAKVEVAVKPFNAEKNGFYMTP